MLETYGAVEVSAGNMMKLLEAGEAVLLFPGGRREVRLGMVGGVWCGYARDIGFTRDTRLRTSIPASNWCLEERMWFCRATT